ncbi:MAG TPA: hypothetical protein H9830_06760 [Candidatus Agrococcus pullicola]|uniref:Uncharacterized protein n=1 Tax=Candidatus Agrococcus pullicola TaxID=2838429 RepID=A0A9D1YUH1_9MICO|nr:hypothetical protein [Candidatus Agrococcus pullicola]
MAATLRSLLLVPLYVLVGIVSCSLLSLFWFFVDLYFFVTGGSFVRSRTEWFYSDHFQWFHVCILVVLACVLTVGAVRLRYFAITVGAIMCVLSPLSHVAMHILLSIRPDVVISGDWPLWGFDLGPVFIGSILITLHFLVPVRHQRDIAASTDEDTHEAEPDEESEVANEHA